MIVMSMRAFLESTYLLRIFSIPQMTFNFEPISKIISERAKGAFVDVCAVINNVGSVDSINTRAGKQLEKRDLEIVDDSTKEKMRCTLWGQQAVDVIL